MVLSGSYKTNSEIIRDGLRLLQEKQTVSKLEILRQMIDEGEKSGVAKDWDVDKFLLKMKNS